MMRSLAMWIGLRYTRAKRRNHFISFISLVSMLGIVIGVTALITVISVMNGFESELRTRILGMVSHATISAADDQAGMDDWQKAIDLSGTDPRVLGAAPYAEREGLLQGQRGLIQGALLRGIDPAQEAGVSQLSEKMIRGDMASLGPGDFNIVLGKELALWLNVDIGDTVTVYVPEFRTTPVGVLPQMKR
ncbi:MAG TPA: ABC transporter permease, partial [Xanthomonadaceae bacterium]|nr:ABC transporter permease [Xanthomonadaceae bacterium]